MALPFVQFHARFMSLDRPYPLSHRPVRVAHGTPVLKRLWSETRIGYPDICWEETGLQILYRTGRGTGTPLWHLAGRESQMQKGGIRYNRIPPDA